MVDGVMLDFLTANQTGEDAMSSHVCAGIAERALRIAVVQIPYRHIGAIPMVDAAIGPVQLIADPQAAVDQQHMTILLRRLFGMGGICRIALHDVVAQRNGCIHQIALAQVLAAYDRHQGLQARIGHEVRRAHHRSGVAPAARILGIGMHAQ